MKLKAVEITDSKVSAIRRLREHRDELKAKIEDIERGLSELEAEAIAYIEAGGSPLLEHFMSVEVTTRVIPKWKQEFIKMLGEKAAKTVIDSTEPTTYKKLIITTRR